MEAISAFSRPAGVSSACRRDLVAWPLKQPIAVVTDDGDTGSALAGSDAAQELDYRGA